MLNNIFGGTRQEIDRRLRVGIILGLLVASAVLGWRTPSMVLGGSGIEIVIGSIVLIIAVVVGLRYIELGVIAIVLTAFFVRFTLPTGTASRIPASMVLAGLMIGVWVIWMFLRHQVTLVPSRVNVPLLGFIIVSILSYPWSWLSWRPEFFSTADVTFKFQIAQLGGLAVMVLLPAVLFLAMNLLRDVKWAKWLLVIMVVIAVPELLQRVTGKYLQFGGLGVSGPGLYHLWLVSLVYAQVLFNKQLSRRVRFFFIFLIVAWFLYLFGINLKWFSGWLTFLVAIVFLSFLKSKKGTIVLILFMLVPFILAADYYYEHIWIKAQTDDWNRFTFLWPTILFDLTLTKAGIVFGAGPAGYTPYFMTYYPGQSMSAHNNYVDIIAETGIVGTFFFVWFLVAVFRTGWKQQALIKDDFLLAFNNGVLGGFVGMLVAMILDDWFIPFAYNNGLPGFDMNVYAWILIGMMLSLGRLVQPEDVAPSAQGAMTVSDASP